MIFPGLKNHSFGYLNLDLEARMWSSGKNIKFESSKNPLLDPDICERFVNEVHKKYSLDYSYGGWLEDRTFIWRQSYLEKDKKFIHLGVDINVPALTEIAASFKAKVVKIDDDYPEDMGWGPRVVLQNMEEEIYVIYAHLDRALLCKTGDILKKGTIFAKVGHTPENGNWFPHLHLQTIDSDYYNYLAENDQWALLDGYGYMDDMTKNSARFRDPLQYISLN